MGLIFQQTSCVSQETKSMWRGRYFVSQIIKFHRLQGCKSMENSTLVLLLAGGAIFSKAIIAYLSYC